MGAECPILAVTDNKKTFNQLALVFNVHPVYVETKEDTDATVEAGIQKLKAQGILEEGDKVILSKGHASAALYAVLAQKGFFSKDELKGLLKGFIKPFMFLVPGVLILVLFQE